RSRVRPRPRCRVGAHALGRPCGVFARFSGRVVHIMTSLTALWNRVLQILGRLSMYRLTLLALIGLAVVAFVLSFFGLVVPAPLELVVTLAVLVGAGVGVDAVAQRILHLPHRYESSIITAHILLFVLRPTI